MDSDSLTRAMMFRVKHGKRMIMCGESATRIQKPPQDSMQSLASSILAQAVKDIKSRRKCDAVPRREAMQWIYEGGEGFKFWCSVVGLNPTTIREILLNKYVTEEELKKLEEEDAELIAS